jgi:hypothetical protein
MKCGRISDSKEAKFVSKLICSAGALKTGQRDTLFPTIELEKVTSCHRKRDILSFSLDSHPLVPRALLCAESGPTLNSILHAR